jgi:hypothetical protein
VNAYEPISGEQITSIAGMIGSIPFQCEGSRCDVPVEQDARLTVWANSSLGDESEHVIAEVRVSRLDGGYTVSLNILSGYSTYTDACAEIWGIKPSAQTPWSTFPQSPDQLYTQRTLHYLAAQLINVGLVDVSDCPGGGYLFGMAPSACGLERAAAAMTDWQNQFNAVIWTAGRETGIPPLMLKGIIELESQFWPGNARFVIHEYGLGQLNQLGADVALRWESDLYQRVCDGLLLDCTKPYASLPGSQQAMARGEMMRLISAECATCQYGVDLSMAQQSVPVIADVLRGNCRQVNFVLNEYNVRASYEDLWRFTMVSYHGGYQCLVSAITEARKNGDLVNWETLSSYLTNCPGARTYVDDLWDILYDYPISTGITELTPVPTIMPTYLPTAVPLPTSTPALAHSTVRVLIYEDANGNQVAETNELVSDLSVQANFASGRTEVKEVQNGEAIFDASGEVIGSFVTVNVPNLFRSYTTNVVAEGELTVVFRLVPPEIPEVLP